jgi:hypothetical protein
MHTWIMKQLKKKIQPRVKKKKDSSKTLSHNFTLMSLSTVVNLNFKVFILLKYLHYNLKKN